ncbi:MAG: hypothetical protein JXQ72_17205 [Anaerolineae bacterium]|nr:hypothetical protein [Anaerolineae bacterium]
MLPDKSPQPGAVKPDNEPGIELIPPDEADAILDRALEPYLADGWNVFARGVNSVRLTRGMRNLDVRVDLLGQVEIQESGLTPLQESGRLTAWVLLWTILLLALAISAALGIL